jgi:hypothetical protein
MCPRLDPERIVLASSPWTREGVAVRRESCRMQTKPRANDACHFSHLWPPRKAWHACCDADRCNSRFQPDDYCLAGRRARPGIVEIFTKRPFYRPIAAALEPGNAWFRAALSHLFAWSLARGSRFEGAEHATAGGRAVARRAAAAPRERPTLASGHGGGPPTSSHRSKQAGSQG